MDACPCNEKPKTEDIWYAGEQLIWDGHVYADRDLDEVQALLDYHKVHGRKAAVIHEGCCHYLYLPEDYLVQRTDGESGPNRFAS